MNEYCCLILLMMVTSTFARQVSNHLSDTTPSVESNNQCETIANTPREWVDALHDLIFDAKDHHMCASEDLIIKFAAYPDSQQVVISSIDVNQSFWARTGTHISMDLDMSTARRLLAEGLSSKEIAAKLFIDKAERIGMKTPDTLLQNIGKKIFLHVISKSAVKKLASSQSFEVFNSNWDNLFHILENLVYCKWVDGEDLCEVDHPVSIQFNPSIKKDLKEKSLSDIIGCSEDAISCCKENPNTKFCSFRKTLLEKRTYGGQFELLEYYESIQDERTLAEARAFFSALIEYYPSDSESFTESISNILIAEGELGFGNIVRGDINMYDMEPVGASIFLTTI